jgi:16S rRNA (uracil1498-N3)-methyltransferase
MHRFFMPPETCSGDLLRLDGREAHHALRVLRLQPGDEVTVLDGAGCRMSCRVDQAGRDTASLRVLRREHTPAPPCPVSLILALPKGKIIDSIIAKSVELGANRLFPLLTEHVVTRLDEHEAMDKQQKWQQSAIEAVKQCGAAWLPNIAPPMSLEKFLARGEQFELPVVGSLQTPRRHLRECFQDFQTRHGRRPQSAAVWIGPEGDFSPDELNHIQASGALPISLGPLVLRVETAAIYCLSVFNHELSAP